MVDDVKQAGSDLRSAGVTYPQRNLNVGINGGTLGFGGELGYTIPKTNDALAIVGTINTGGEYSSGGTPFHEGPAFTARADFKPLQKDVNIGSVPVEFRAGVSGGVAFDNRHGVKPFIGPIFEAEEKKNGFNLSLLIGVTPFGSSSNPEDHNGFYKYNNNIPIIAVTAGKKF